MLLAVAFVFHLTPRLTRPEVFFGVTVRSDFRDSAAGRGLTRIFRYWIWGMTAVAAAVVIAGPAGNPGPVLVGFGGAFAWYLVHRMARKYAVRPSSEREAVLARLDARLPGNWLVNLGPFLALAGVALYLHLNYDALPERIPVHWDIHGAANQYVDKNAVTVFRLPALGAVICGTLALSAFSIARHSKRISVRGASALRELRFRKMILAMLVGTEYYIVCMLAWITVASRTSNAMPFARYVVPAMAILPLPVVVYLSIRYGQGGSRLADAPTTTLGLADGAGAMPVGDRTPDECWKWGQIYYNPGDAAIWVEKRAGVGYTLNFARPLAWAILLLVLLGPLVVVRLMRS